MKTRLAQICIILVLLSFNVNAFPLTGGNGLINVTVFGVITTDYDYGDTVSIRVDMASEMSGYDAVLVDDDDNFYQGDTNPPDYVSGEPNQYTKHFYHYSGSTIPFPSPERAIINFAVPKGSIIKRLRIEHHRITDNEYSRTLPQEYFTPISIDWKGVPEMSNGNTHIKFYGSTYEDGNPSSTQKSGRRIWENTLKITNNGTQNMEFRYSDVIFEDQYGWNYEGSSGDYTNKNEEVLLPGESMKMVVLLSGVSPLSRLVKLKYQNMSMDISAWT